MTIYYIRQDNSIPGCGDPACCGEYYEEIDEFFHKCDCKPVDPSIEPDIALHLQSCAGGGPVLKWRKAKDKETQAFNAGYLDGHSAGWHGCFEWQKKKEGK